MTYYSRSRQELWCKGDTSGHYQYVKELSLDCDNDTILAKVHQVGAACHTGSYSCFFKELAKKDSVVDLLENKVVLIKPKDGETKVTGFENITDAANIALAGDSVPVGQYSREIFDNLGITDEVNKMEINEGKNVSEVLAAVSEGSNEIGIVYATDAASVVDKVDVIAEAPADALKTPVRYPVGLIEDKEASEDDTAAAEAFLEYIKSDDAMKVFEKYGFTAYKTDDASETDDKDAEATEEADDTETNAETETTEEAK